MSTQQILPPVFIGSTYLDLEPYRDAVRETLHQMEVLARGMEYFGASTDPPKEKCLATVRSCSAYIGIFGMRYGSIDPETEKSMTHIEYEHAQQLRLPSLIYLIDEHKQPVLPKFVDTGEHAKRLADLKEELKARFTVSFFTTPEDLGRRIAQDLPRILNVLKSRPRSSELEQVIRRIPRIDWLDDEIFEFLKKKSEPSAKMISSDSILREVMEFLLSGEKMAAVFLIHQTSDFEIRKSMSIAMKIGDSIEQIITHQIEIIQDQRKK
jgi:hypothetical protein